MAIKQEVRSTKIRNAVKRRASEYCEACNQKTFMDKKGNYYLEVHHIDLLSDGGKDNEYNACAICPNCHARIHYGSYGENYNAHLKIKIREKQDLIEREKEFKKELKARSRIDPLSH
jgi:5-methylcytosine-specific restriction protein A